MQIGTSLADQCLGLCTSNAAGCMGLAPNRIPQALRRGQKKKMNADLKNGEN